MYACIQRKCPGRVREIRMGKPGLEIVVGGQATCNSYLFDRERCNAPRLALQVWDIEPEEWPPEALQPFKDVVGDPVSWATKCVDEYEADAVCLRLAGTDPHGKNLSAQHAATVARSVAESVTVPLIVWSVSQDEKNAAVLTAVAESCSDLNLVLGPVTGSNYRQVAAEAIACHHTIVANSPGDINLARRLNGLLANLGIPRERILIDPTSGRRDYGTEYCYRIVERIRQAALIQNDHELQYPIVSNIAEEVWKVEQALVLEQVDRVPGNAAAQGVKLEAMTAVKALQAGSDLLILRHPTTLAHIRQYLSEVVIRMDRDPVRLDPSAARDTLSRESSRLTSSWC